MSSLIRPLVALCLALAFGSASVQAAVINATYSGSFQGWIAGDSAPHPGEFNAQLSGWLSIKEPTTSAVFNPDEGTTTYSGNDTTPITYWAATGFTLSHPTSGSSDYFYEFPVIQFSHSASGQTLQLNHPFWSFKYQLYMSFTGAPGSLFASSDPAKLVAQPSWADIESAFLFMTLPDQSGKGVITNMVFASPVGAPPVIALLLPALLLLGGMRQRGGEASRPRAPDALQLK